MKILRSLARMVPPLERVIVERNLLRSEVVTLVGDYSLSPWFSVLQGARRTIAGEAPNSYYVGTYQAEEMLYWLHIPDWIVEDWGEAPTPRRVLDVGAGWGTLALFCRRMFDAEVYCSDGFVDNAATLAANHGMSFARANIELDPVPWPEPMNVVVLTEVLEHFNFHPVPTLAKIRSSMAPGGVIYVSTPDADAWGRVTEYYRSYDDMPQPTEGTELADAHIYTYTGSELRAVLAAAGFEITRWATAPGRWHRHFNVSARASG